MEIVTDLILNLKKPNINTIAHAKQGDKLTRWINADLMDGDSAWTVPNDTNALIRFRKPDGKGGLYDKTEDGNPAIEFTGSKAKICLAEQTMTCPGPVLMELNLYNTDGEILSSFHFVLEVEESTFPDDELLSDDYFNVISEEFIALLNRVDAVAGLTATAQDIPEGQTTHVTVEGGTGTDDPYVFTFYIQKGQAGTSAKMVVSKTGHIITFTAYDTEHGTTEETVTEPTIRVEKQGSDILITATDSEGTTSETVIAGSVLLPSLHIDTNTGLLMIDVPTGEGEFEFSINSAGYLIVTY